MPSALSIQNYVITTTMIYKSPRGRVVYHNPCLLWFICYRSRRLFRMAIILWSSYFNVLHKYFVVEIFVGIHYVMCKYSNILKFRAWNILSPTNTVKMCLWIADPVNRWKIDQFCHRSIEQTAEIFLALQSTIIVAILTNHLRFASPCNVIVQFWLVSS